MSDTSHPARFLKEGNIKLDNLFTICQVLNYNFFKALATTLPADLPPHHTTESDAQIQELQQQARDRDIEIKPLKEALGLVGEDRKGFFFSQANHPA